jgi:hypothetical protein
MRDAKVLAADAEQLINNPAHREALARLEAEIVRKIVRTEFNGSVDAERYREKLNLLLYLNGKYKTLLAAMIGTGQLEEHALEERKRFKKAGL